MDITFEHYALQRTVRELYTSKKKKEKINNQKSKIKKPKTKNENQKTRKKVKEEQK